MSKYSGKSKAMDFKPQVLGEQVSQILIDAILQGSLKQGDQLIEADLQQHFNVSRSPLREAFRDLEKKGLVEIIPRRGAFVRTVTTKDIEENFPVRATLEGLAASPAGSAREPDSVQPETDEKGAGGDAAGGCQKPAHTLSQPPPGFP